MPDYTKGKIYKICSNNPDIVEVYYGSTVQPLCERIAGHRASYKRWIDGNTKFGCSIFYCFKQYGVGQFHIELVENYSCENKEQLLSYENKFIRNNECVNKYSAILSVEEKKEYKKQYSIDNKEKISDHSKQFYLKNKDKIKEQTKQYSENNKDKIKQYQAKYREDNKEKYKEYFKQRYQAKKESI